MEKLNLSGRLEVSVADTGAVRRAWAQGKNVPLEPVEVPGAGRKGRRCPRKGTVRSDPG